MSSSGQCGSSVTVGEPGGLALASRRGPLAAAGHPDSEQPSAVEVLAAAACRGNSASWN
jgi:hypothetical protein